MPKVIIGALQKVDHFARLLRCRSTWMADAAKLDVQSMFLVGAGREVAQPVLSGDFCLLPCPDAYPTLPQRTRWWCRWALAQEGWDYLFKCDSDTYVSLPRLLCYPTNGAHYVGGEWQKGVGYGSGGAGYFLSRTAAHIVATKLLAETGAEDLLVGQVLKEAGIPFTLEPRLIAFGSMERRPRRGNDLITVHGVQADAFLAAHQDTGLAAGGGHA